MESDFVKKLKEESKREDQIESWFPDAGALIYQAFQDHSSKLDGRLVSIIGGTINKRSDPYLRNKQIFLTVRDEWVKYCDGKFDYQWRLNQVGKQKVSSEAMVYIGEYFTALEK